MKRLLVPLLIVVLAQAAQAPPPPSSAAPATACFPQYENEWVLPEAVCA